MGTKHMVLAVRRCDNCGLLYRLPTRLMPELYDSIYHSDAIWSDDYKTGNLSKMAAKKFRSTKWDYYDKLSIVRALKSRGRVLDFGGGSGIIAFQLTELGFDVEVFEVAVQLREISEGLLRIPTHGSLSDLRSPDKSGAYDVVFSHHVLEHLDRLDETLSLWKHILRKDGLIVSFVPNGGSRQHGGDLAATIDSAHICAFEASFFQRNLSRVGLKCATFSTPYAFEEGTPEAGQTKAAEGRELAFVAWHEDQPTPKELEDWPYRLPSIKHSKRAQAGC